MSGFKLFQERGACYLMYGRRIAKNGIFFIISYDFSCASCPEYMNQHTACTTAGFGKLDMSLVSRKIGFSEFQFIQGM